MALPPSTANWHWKNKNVTPWAKDWLQTELTTLSVNGDNGESVSIAEVTSVEGDVELGQRKSKLLTIFDCDVRARWTGTTSSGTQVEGTVRIPEISHEIICDQLEDYRYEWSLKTASSAEVDAVYALARSRLPAAMEAKLATFPSTIVEVHGKDVYIGGTASGQSTPPVVSAPSTSAAASTVSAAPAKAASAPVKKTAKPPNTSTITVEASFQASADDLFGLLTDEKRIPAWTRNAAVSQAKPDTQYSLFGGGVKGTYVSLTSGKEIIQTWALQSPTWPQGHEATLTTSFDQSTDSTKVTFTLTGVPTGMEDELRRNIEGYYVHGFKSIGYVAFTPAEPIYSSDYLRKRQAQTKKRSAPKPADTTPSLYLPAAIIGTLVVAAAFAIPYLSSSSLPRPGSA